MAKPPTEPLARLRAVIKRQDGRACKESITVIKDASMIEFNITQAPDQQFGVVLNGRRVTIRLRYNPTSDRWTFDLAIDDEPVLMGRCIVTGVDLLDSFDFGIGAIFALSETTDDILPTRNNLPAGLVKLYHAEAL